MAKFPDEALGAEPVDTAHLPAVLEGLAQAKVRHFATDDEVEMILKRFCEEVEG
jgi:hypothetical protein